MFCQWLHAKGLLNQSFFFLGVTWFGGNNRWSFAFVVFLLDIKNSCLSSFWLKKKKTCLSWVYHAIGKFCAKTFKYANHFSMIYYLFIYLFLWKVWRHLSNICNTYSTSFIKGMRFNAITIRHMQYIVYIIHYWIAIRCNNQLTFLRTKIQSLCTIKQVSFVARVCDE